MFGNCLYDWWRARGFFFISCCVVFIKVLGVNDIAVGVQWKIINACVERLREWPAVADES